jgi:hypothetical protein
MAAMSFDCDTEGNLVPPGHGETDSPARTGRGSDTYTDDEWALLVPMIRQTSSRPNETEVDFT